MDPKRQRRADRQRRKALALLIFGVVRTLLWLAMIVLVLAGVPWASSIAGKVVFIALISFYANAATDFDQVVSAFAALVAADSRRDVKDAQDDLARRTLRVAEDIEQRQLMDEEVRDGYDD